MADFKATTVPFFNKGIVQKVDPAQLRGGQLQQELNTTSLQEGAITIRGGTQRKNGSFALAGVPHTIAKLHKTAGDANNYRYVGVGQHIYRGAATDTGPWTDLKNLGSTAELVRWTSEDYAMGISGTPTKYIATNTFMLKDDGTFSSGTIQNWGIVPPTRPVQVTTASPGTCDTSGTAVSWVTGLKFPSTLPGNTLFIAGTPYVVQQWVDNENLVLTSDAGTQSGASFSIAPNGEVVANYDWLYTFRNDITGAESNPCVPMIDSNTVVADGSTYTVTVWGTADSQILTTSNHKTIAIYRRGGIFADGLYRLVGYVTNPGAASSVNFTDNVLDDALVNANILEFDNDPPVTSNMPIPLVATIASSTPDIASAGNQFSSVTLNTPTSPTGISNLATIITVGSTITVGPTQEQVIIESISGLVLGFWSQSTQANGSVVTADAITGSPARFCCQAFGSFFIAGDTNNPHVLYKSKTARPESWPVVNLETGNSGNVVVGSPANPIMNITEFNGQVVCMNLSNIYTVNVWGGALQAPVQTPAKRGLLWNFAWCKVGNEIWYLAYDGVYSWSGGLETKRSEAINPIFSGQTVNGIAPMNMNPPTSFPPNSGLEFVTFEYHNFEVQITYVDINGSAHRLRYHTIYDRWYIVDDNLVVYAMHTDKDTGVLVLGKFENGPGSGWLDYDDTGSSDSWSSVGTDGSAISFTLFTEFYDLGTPGAEKHFGDLVLELNNASAASMTVAVYWDYGSSADANNTFTISAAAGRRTISLPIQNATPIATGHDARAMAVKITGSSANPLTLYSLTFNALPLEFKQRGRAYDWDDLGHPYDKRLTELTIEYDTAANPSATGSIIMDTKSGILGTTETLNVQVFPLNGTGRCRANFAVAADTIVKMVRMRPSIVTPQDESIMIWNYKFQQENYPPDTVSYTDWENSGTPYNKYYQQVVLDVDTGGIAATVQIQIVGEGGGTNQTFSVNTTANNRSSITTLQSSLIGKQARLVIVPGTNGKFQLFSHTFIVLPADKGPVTHSFDWDDLEHPYDKRLETVTIEYDTGGTSTVIRMDTLTGINGTTQNANVQQFTLSGAGRSKQTFAINDGTIAKMIKLYPAPGTPNTTFKEWKYVFNFIKYPADTVYFTEWSALDYSCEKILRELSIEMDTGGVACSVAVQIDGSTVYTFSMTTTSTDRSRIITMPSRPNELIGKLIRLVFTPGGGGKAQLFNYKWSRVLEPCYLTHWSSFQQNYGSNGYKLLKQVWVEYICAGSVTVTIYTDDNAVFYTTTLPSHASRDIERFYVPAIDSGVLNKSYIYTIDVDSADTTKPFKLYRDGTRLEVKNMNGEQRDAYQQKYLWEVMPLDIGGGT